MNTTDLLKETLKDINVKVECAGYDHHNIVSIFVGDLLTITAVALENAGIRMVLPDSIAHLGLDKVKNFDLHQAASIEQIKRFVTDIAAIAENRKFTEEDRKIIADAFQERLPMVWQDAENALKDGQSLERVLEEMNDGHILRILRRCGIKMNGWLEEFKEYHA